ncbi:hypothetical protein B0A55_11460 [Friedmanniomyces simplex]|uniref:Uncharacterized protein n=1 Tax=Friedmanniomyces simplex TaxID=329884 RepID=A0A4U0WJJ5_9PEZI|nr:hypothetical protein B0A55_11460 [Friedmanniomyces simplex]
MSYWVPDPYDASDLLIDEITARLRDHSHGDKAHHATPGDVKAVLIRMVQSGKEGD